MTTIASLDFHRFEIRMPEILPFAQQRFIHIFGKRVSEAVSKVQSGLVAPLAEVAVGGSRDFRLSRRDRLDCNPGYAKEIIEATGGDRVSAAFNNGRSLDVIGGRDALHSR